MTYLTDEQIYARATDVAQTFEPGIYAASALVDVRGVRRGDAVMISVSPYYVTRAAVVVSVGTGTVTVCWANPATPGDFGRSAVPLQALRIL